MDRTIPYPSKICNQRWEKRRLEMHRDRLNNMKATIDTSEPKAVKMDHVFNNLKKEQMLEERYSDIDRENRILLKKMSNIMRSPRDEKVQSTTTTPRDRTGKQETPRGPASGGLGPVSLNRDQRKKELLRITKENQHILRRIQQAQPAYNHVEWDATYRKNTAYLKNSAEYPLILRQPRKNPMSSQLVPIGENEPALQDTGSRLALAQQEQLEGSPNVVFQDNRSISGSNYRIEMFTDGRMLIIAARSSDKQTKLELLVKERAHKKLMHEVHGEYALLAQRLHISNGRLTMSMDAALPAASASPSTPRKPPPEGTTGFVPPSPGRASGRGQLPEGADNRILDADSMVASSASGRVNSAQQSVLGSAGTVGRATTAEFEGNSRDGSRHHTESRGVVNAEIDVNEIGEFTFRVRGLTPDGDESEFPAGPVPDTPTSVPGSGVR